MPSCKTDSYEEKSTVIPEGDYPFKVVSAVDKIAKTSGNDMIAMQLEFNTGSGTMKVYENLVFTPAALFKIKQFCDAVGMEDKYVLSGKNLNVSLDKDDCFGARGIAHLAKGEKYMEVQWFVGKKAVEQKAATKAQADEMQDLKDNPALTGEDIPF